MSLAQPHLHQSPAHRLVELGAWQRRSSAGQGAGSAAGITRSNAEDGVRRGEGVGEQVPSSRRDGAKQAVFALVESGFLELQQCKYSEVSGQTHACEDMACEERGYHRLHAWQVRVL